MAMVIQFDKEILLKILHQYINNPKLEEALTKEFVKNNPNLPCSEYEGTDYVLLRLSKLPEKKNIAINSNTEFAYILKDGDKYSIELNSSDQTTDIGVKVPPKNN